MKISAAFLAACVCVALAGASLLTAAPAPAAEATPQQLEEHAERLGDPDARVRDEAAEALRAAGPAAETALRAVSETGDPEAARRAKRLLQEIRQPAPEELPPDDPIELTAYRGAEEDEKLHMIQQFARQGQRESLLLARLWTEEPAEELRAAIFAAMLQSPGRSATALVAGGNAPAAERLLEAALAQRSDGAAASYASLALLRGRLDETRAQWSGRVPRDDREEAATVSTVLAYLHRAAGDPRSAAGHALAAGDTMLAVQCQLDAGDFPAAAAAVSGWPELVGGGLQQLAPLAGMLRAAGNADGLDDVVRRIVKRANAESADDVARALLLVGRFDDALRVLDEHGRWFARFKTLEAQDRLDAAFELVRAKDEERTEQALLLRVAAAEHLHELGKPKEAADLLARVERENEEVKSYAVAGAMGTAARRMKMPEQAWDHFLVAVRLENEEEGGPNRSLWQAFKVEGAEVDGGTLWLILSEWFADETLEQRFARVRAVLERTLPLDELKDLAGAHDVDGGARAHAAHLFREAGQRMRDAGDEAGALKYLEEAAANAPAPAYAAELYQRMGDWAADKEDWASAATSYARAWNADRTAPLPLYLRGWALREAGWHARAGELLNLAHLLPLAEAGRRFEVMQALHERGITAELAREATAVLRTGRPDIASQLQAWDYAQRHTAEMALRDGDPLSAAVAYERSILGFLEFVGRFGFVDQTPYVRLPHTAGRLRAKGLLARGDVAAAEREIAACRAMVPGDVMLAIDVVPEFERLGNQARADELYAEAMAAQEAALAAYPDSASHHNSLAWLAVVCGRDADKAMAHAQRAVALRPDSASILDTLAEAQFRRGQIDEAIKTMTRCAELEPTSPRHREQLERFEAAKRGEQRPMPPG